MILIIESLNSFFSLKIIIIINISPYPPTEALLSPAQIYLPNMAFLYQFNKLFWFIISTFKPKSRIIDFSKGYIS